ncbi:MAG: transcription initiation factor IIB [Candidatus Lokiarchaeota archaeon]|nr:transcription initiation factor IIB [Candidatus Lokiarchaeota archaeon]
MVRDIESTLETGYKNCSECGGLLVFNSRMGELTCSNCGLVVKDQIFSRGPDWREFNQEQREKRRRVGNPFTYTIHDHGLSTVIDTRNRDYLGKILSNKKLSKVYRLRKLHNRTQISNSNQRSMIRAFTELDRLKSALNLTISRSIREEVALLYRKMLNNDLTKGRSIKLIITTILYIVSRQNNIPITFDDLSSNSEYDKKSINRMYRFICRKLKISIKPPDPVNYVSRFSSTLNLDMDVERLAIKIINDAKIEGISSGKGLMGLIAGALYIASILKKQRRTQKDIASVVNITDVTLRTRYKELVEELDIDL